ncbi:MAG: adenylyltransferase/cytidyltransferase family protein [Clostridia bacterium]|nr:adenylyltransferase/cytidyltransferase family protein [Clostridia bacterium]
MGKRYRAGMYGGKFMPYHRGHLFCLETASAMCDTVWQLLMVGCVQEEEILSAANACDRQLLSPESRLRHMLAAAERLGNVKTLLIDISRCRTPDDQEDWDAETPLVLKACGHFEAVFGSEPSYAPYFARAYPWADYILVDPPRFYYPISGTALRLGEEDCDKWIV